MAPDYRQTRRCKARTHRGHRCRRRITYHVERCFEHDKNFFIRPSTIPGAGRGLFAKNGLVVGDVIDEYSGKLKTQEEYNRSDSVYGMRSRGMVIDASGTQTCISRLINDGQIDSVNNCRFVSFRGRVLVVVIQPIPVGGELLASYGPTYWS